MAELKPVQRGERWRVEMSWPGYNARSIGEFDSEAEAAAWIKRHSWLAPEPKTSAALPVPKSSSESWWRSICGRQSADCSHGFAKLGTIGFEGRRDYAAIGTVSNVASRLCDEAKHPVKSSSARAFGNPSRKAVTVESVGEFELKGIRRPMAAYNVLSTAVFPADRFPRLADKRTFAGYGQKTGFDPQQTFGRHFDRLASALRRRVY
jgi:hypothetical protein